MSELYESKLKALFTIGLVLTEFLLCGQNLVPNPSFEDTLACPVSQGQVDRAVNWNWYYGSADYYNSCHTIDSSSPYQNVSVPNSWLGHQSAATGSAYVGMIVASPSSTNQEREFVGCALSEALQIGITYYICFKTNAAYAYLDNGSQAACFSNNLGMHFTTNPYPLYGHSPVNNSPHFFHSTTITDTSDWTLVSGSFIADSAYTHITIGNFFDRSQTQTMCDTATQNTWAYYFIDDVCVTSDSGLCLEQLTAIEQPQKSTSYRLYPQPMEDRLIIEFCRKRGLEYSIVIYNMNGQVMTKKSGYMTGRIELERDNLEAGSYLVKLLVGQEVIYDQILISK